MKSDDFTSSTMSSWALAKDLVGKIDTLTISEDNYNRSVRLSGVEASVELGVVVSRTAIVLWLDLKYYRRREGFDCAQPNS